MLHGTAAGLRKTAWARVGIIASEHGSTLGELRDYFAKTPDARIVINDATWRAMVANGVNNDTLHVITPSGEVNPTGYDASWRVWVKGYEPQPQTDTIDTDDGREASDRAETSGTSGGNNSGGLSSRQSAFTSGKMPGRAAYEAVKRFMTDKGYD